MQGLMKVIQSSYFQDKTRAYIQKKYDDGLLKSESTFNLNFVRNDRSLNILQEYVSGRVGNATEQINQDLRAEIQRAMIDGTDLDGLKTRIREMFDKKTYMHRIKTVIRTEGARAMNKAQLDAAAQSGFKVRKYIHVILDGNTSPICKKANKKYGKPEQAIELNENFKFSAKVGKKTIHIDQDAPPFHPNCRTSLRFVREKPEEQQISPPPKKGGSGLGLGIAGAILSGVTESLNRVDKMQPKPRTLRRIGKKK